MKTLLLLALVGSASAQSSADYALSVTVLDDAGSAQSSASYNQLATLGGVPGLATDAIPSVNRSGFAGQLYEPVSLSLSPDTAALFEGTSLQPVLSLLLDDATTLAVPPGEAAWTIESGPITSINAGLVTAGYVYLDTPSRARVSHGLLSARLDLLIRNVGDDDFGSYAGDGLSDAWQVSYFGTDSPLARPGSDPDGDGEDNLVEFLTGYTPTDASSLLTAHPVSLTGATLLLELSRVQPGTCYHVESSPDLVTWTPLLTIAPSALSEPFSQPLPAPGPRTFYRVKVSAPALP